jgi:hypothetical protein
MITKEQIAPNSTRSAITAAVRILQHLELPLEADAPAEDIECWDYLDTTKFANFHQDLTEAIECLNQARNRFTHKLIQRTGV